MGDPSSDFRPSPDAQDVAKALRSGLAARRSPLDADARGADEARLRDLGDLEGLPPVAKPGPAAPIVKSLRRFLQVFLRPWLATQTIFNREMARRFQNMVTSVRDLERRAPHAEKGLEHLLARVQQLEERLAPPNLSQQDAGGDPGADRSIERMFVHSRIPRPPSRVLTLDDGATGVAMELAAFGFDVWVSDDGPNQDEHPKLRRYRPVLGALPFAEATFDVVVSMSSSARRVQKDPAYVEKDPACVEKDPAYGAEVAELVRVLKPGGRFIVTCSAGDHGSDPGTIASMLAPLRVTEMLRATRNDGVWSVAAADVVEPQRVKREAIALVVAERPEAETLSGPGA